MLGVQALRFSATFGCFLEYAPLLTHLAWLNLVSTRKFADHLEDTARISAFDRRALSQSTVGVPIPRPRQLNCRSSRQTMCWDGSWTERASRAVPLPQSCQLLPPLLSNELTVKLADRNMRLHEEELFW